MEPLLDWRAETVTAALEACADGAALAHKELFMSVRVALTGRAATPPLIETAVVLGKEICRRRLKRAAEVLRGLKSPAVAGRE